MKLTPSERPQIIDYIYSISAIALDQSKDYLIEGRLSPLASEAGCATIGELVHRAKVEPTGTLKCRIIDAITTNETLFFRDRSPFDLLRHKIIPELIDRQQRNPLKPPIRIWSAACSTGQELYSIAMLLKDMLGDPLRYNFRLLGTDLSDDAVARASAGIFNAVEMGRGLEESLRQKCFQPVAGGWKIRDDLRSLSTFRRFNLMDDFSSLGTFDVIFCRNVAIYFNEKDKARLFDRLSQRLAPHGSLMLGSMESLGQLCPRLESRRHLNAVYYQLKSSQV